VVPRRWRSSHTWYWCRRTSGSWEGDCEGSQKYNWEAAMPLNTLAEALSLTPFPKSPKTLAVFLKLKPN